jgi:hypothetical protein
MRCGCSFRKSHTTRHTFHTPQSRYPTCSPREIQRLGLRSQRDAEESWLRYLAFLPDSVHHNPWLLDGILLLASTKTIIAPSPLQEHAVAVPPPRPQSVLSMISRRHGHR